MEMTGFRRKPFAEVTFTKEEVRVMMRCSETHYDYTCKAMSKQGGLLYWMTNAFTWPDQGDVLEQVLPFRDMDTLCKIVECPPPDVEQIGRALHHSIYKVLTALNEEFRRLNPEPENDSPIYLPVEQRQETQSDLNKVAKDQVDAVHIISTPIYGRGGGMDRIREAFLGGEDDRR